MNIADVLRRLANTIDQHSQGGSPDPSIQNPAELLSIPTGQHAVEIEVSDDKPSPNGKTASGNDKDPDVFLPPLQQKQELLKKAVGVDNVYDDGTAVEQEEDSVAEEDDCEQDREDIVNRIKKLSGIPTAAVVGLTDDEPLEG
jgi:hypothetical protein